MENNYMKDNSSQVVEDIKWISWCGQKLKGEQSMINARNVENLTKRW